MAAGGKRLLLKGLKLPIRGFLSLMIIGALLPLIALLALVVLRTTQTDREAAETSLVNSANIIAAIAESALSANAAILGALGETVLAGTDAATDFSSLEEHFSGQISIAPTAYQGAPDALWHVSNLENITPGESATLTLDVHVDGVDNAHLVLRADARALMRTVSFADVTAGELLVALVDGTGRIIGRSIDEQAHLGSPVPTWDALLAVDAPMGVFTAQAFDGTAISFGFASVAGTPGWVVVVGMPKAIFDARWRNPIIAFGIVALVAIAAAMAFALWLSRRISQPIAAMVERSRAIARDHPGPLPDAPDTVVREIATLYDAQMNSHARLTQRASELALSSQRYSAVAKIGALVTWRSTPKGEVLEAEGWPELTGKAPESALGRGWRDSVHPDDLDGLIAILAGASRNGSHLTVEARFCAPDDQWTWVMMRGAAILDGSGNTVELVGTLENIDERMRYQAHIRHLAYHDALTGLPNRVKLFDHFNELWSDRRSALDGALLFIDLDLFKKANDTHGHAAGDELLRQVATRLKQGLRDTDLAARLGGDEFAVVLSPADTLQSAEMVASRLIKSLSRPFDIGGQSVVIGASIGISAFTPGAMSIERLQFEADTALYRAKSDGRNRYAVFGAEDSAMASRA